MKPLALAVLLALLVDWLWHNVGAERRDGPAGNWLAIDVRHRTTRDENGNAAV